MGYPPQPPSNQPYPPQQPGDQYPSSSPWQPGHQQSSGYPPQPSGPYPQQPSNPYPQQQPSGPYPQQPSSPYPQQPSSAPYPSYGGMASPLPTIPPAKRRSALPRLLASGAVLLVILIIAGIFAAINNHTSGDGSYSTALPGDSCDKGGGYWIKNQNQDSSMSFTCQSNGLLVTQSSNFDLAVPVYFGGKDKSYTFPQHYRVQVNATLSTGGPQTLVGLSVHDPIQDNVVVLGQAFAVETTGFWTAYRGDTSGNLTTFLGEGVVGQQTKTMKLAVEVNGPVMTFSVNDVKATTITDATYTTTSSVALVLQGDSTANSPASVLFSQFQYKPLTGATISTNDAQATATAVKQQPYQATTPGQGCDKNGGQWAAPAQFGDTDTSVTCTAAGTQVSHNTGSQSISRLRYYGTNGTLPNNYTVSVKADLHQLKGGCAGVYTRGSSKGIYRYIVCDDGSWYVDYLDNSGASLQTNALDNGQVAKKTSYTIAAVANGAKQTLMIDGKQVSSVNDSSLSETYYVALLVTSAGNAPGSVTFSAFSFAPQP